MPLPLIAAAVVLISVGTGGAVAGADGVHKMSKANDKSHKAKKAYQAKRKWFTAQQATTDVLVTSYGRYQLHVQAQTLGHWVQWLEANNRKVRQLQRSHLSGVEIAVPDVPTLKLRVSDATDVLSGSVSATAAAIAAQQTALLGVRALATAGTGTAIAGLHGAAAEGATLAWLGGGALAAGGGGVAMGTAVLTGIAVAPALLIGGITLNLKGDQALTEARNYKAQVKKASAEMDTGAVLLHQLRHRVKELRTVVTAMNDRATASLEQLMAVEFDPDQHAELFQETALLMGALGDILATPLLDPHGHLTTESHTITERHSS